MARFKYIMQNGARVRVPFSPAEEAQADAVAAQQAAERPALIAAAEQARREGALLRQARLIRIVEALVDEIEAIRRGDPPTAGIVQLRGFLNNL